MKFNAKTGLIAAAALLTASTSFAQFGGMLGNIKNRVEQAQKPAAPAPDSAPAAPGMPSMPAMPGMPAVPGMPAMPGAAAPAIAAPAAAPAAMPAAGGGVRQKWLSDPYPDIPNEVTDADIQATNVASMNKIFVYLNSPVMAKAYKQCQTVEEARIGARAAEMRQASNNAKTNAEKNQLLEQSKAIDGVKAKISPSTCLLRVIRRATLDLKLEYYGTQPKYGGPKSPDEQLNVVQVFRVARALEKNELTGAFHTAMAEEISINYNEWIDKYLVKVFKANAEELKKQVPANDRRTREQLDAGAEMGAARRVEFYNQAINLVVNMINSDLIKP